MANLANGTVIFGSATITNNLAVGNVHTTAVYTDGIFYANGDPYVTGGGGGGGSYTLPTASPTTLGGVKVDNTTITISGTGVITSKSPVANVANIISRAAYDQANIATIIANAAFTQANTGGGTSNSFSTINIDGTPLTANTPTSQLNFVAGSNITLTPNTISNTITISSTGGGGGGSSGSSISVNYLVVGGGGGGSGGTSGTNFGAGAAGGTVRTGTASLSTGGLYGIGVGLGGAAGSNIIFGANGQSSSIVSSSLSVIAAGGQGANLGGNGAPNADFAGGTGIGGGAQASGGAGAGGNGVNGSSGGTGGVGVSSSITGTAVYYGGGGGGGNSGTGGSGGGGAYATAGTNGLGGGAGGGNASNSWYPGGSGVVIISYISSTPKFIGGVLSTYTSGSDTYQVHTFTSSTSMLGIDLVSGGGTSNSFSTMNVDGTLLTANTPTSQLNILAGSNITLAANTTTNTITINSTGGGGLSIVNWTDIANTSNSYGPQYVNIGYSAGSKNDGTIALGPRAGMEIGVNVGVFYAVVSFARFGPAEYAAFGDNNNGKGITTLTGNTYDNTGYFVGRRAIEAFSFDTNTGTDPTYQWIVAGSNTSTSNAEIYVGTQSGGYPPVYTLIANNYSGQLNSIVNGANVWSIMLADNRICAVGKDGATGNCLILTADGGYVNAWTRRAETETGHLYGITYYAEGYGSANNKFVAVGKDNDPGNELITLNSPDGENWYKNIVDLAYTNYNTQLNDVTSNGTMFVCVGWDESNSTGIIATSDNQANTWTNQASYTQFQNIRLNRVVHDTGITGNFIALGNSTIYNNEGYIFSSVNGVTWTKIATLPSVIFDFESYTNYATVVGTDDAGTTAIYTSNFWSWPNFIRSSFLSQAGYSVSIGSSAGQGQGYGSVAIGASAGQFAQGERSIAIGADAAPNKQPSQSIVINASYNSLDANASGLYINPVRQDKSNTTQALYYDESTKEITYAPSSAAKISSLTNGTNTVTLETSGSLTIPGNIKTANDASISSNVWIGSLIGVPTLDASATSASYSGTNNSAVFDFVANANTVIVVASGVETADTGIPSTITGITGLGLTWTRRAIYLDNPVVGGRNQQSEIWYAINNTASPITDNIAVNFDNTFDDQSMVVASFANCNLNGPWSTNGPYYSNTINGAGHSTITMSTNKPSTTGLVFFGVPTGDDPGYAVGWSPIGSALNGGATDWEYGTLSYKQFGLPETNLVVDSQNYTGNSHGLTIISDVLVGLGDPNKNITKTWTFGADGNLTFPNNTNNKLKQPTNSNLSVEVSKGGSIAFDRTTSGYLTSGDLITFGTNVWTVEAWVNLQDTGTNILAGVGTTPGVNIYFDGTTFNVQSDYGVINTWTDVVPTTNTWHHIAVAYNGEGINAWLDGAQLTGGQQTTTAVSGDYGNRLLSIGAMPWSSAFGSAMKLTNLRIIIGSLLYDPNSSSITVPTSQLTNVTNTQLLLLAIDPSSAYTDTSAFTSMSGSNVVWVSENPPLVYPITDWTFSSNGALILPSTGDILRNGTSILGGASSNLVNGSHTVNLDPDGFLHIDNGQGYIGAPFGGGIAVVSDPTGIVTGTSSFYSLVLTRSANIANPTNMGYIGTSVNGNDVNAFIDAYDDITKTNREWTFNPNGTITFPDGSTQNTAYTGGGGGTTFNGGTITNELNVANNLIVTGNVLFESSNIALGNIADVHITGGNTGQILMTDGSGNLVFENIPFPNTTTYTANSITLTNGVYVSGNLQSIQTFGDYLNTNGTYTFTDGANTGPAWQVDTDFLGVTEFNRIVLNIAYTQASGHTVYVELYNYNTSAWDAYGTYTGLGNYFAFALEVLSSTPYVSAGRVQLKLYHSNTGNPAHQTSIDYMGLEQSYQGPQGPRGPSGNTGATGPAGTSANSFLSVNVGGTLLTANSNTSVLTIVAGNNIILSTNTTTNTITINANVSSAFDKANSSNIVAQSAFDKANSIIQQYGVVLFFGL